LVTARYERGSILLTSNKSYVEWDTIFGDPIIATAILDRLYPLVVFVMAWCGRFFWISDTGGLASCGSTMRR